MNHNWSLWGRQILAIMRTSEVQQRLLAEVAWEGLEDAGLAPDKLAGSSTGVYVGGFMLDSMLTHMGPMNRELIGPHTAVGATMTDDSFWSGLALLLAAITTRRRRRGPR